ncbi:MAG: cellulose synthase/poly-beta-1,6-N-acetylglucosamine synthase-like glycosyltransferase/peptidoglycan/xylan [Candidatus Paceibacteria bacterium]|jgi:cellulose synthase/poly-beta-1,6-N-acetylglucosamine synthase-like glycosyltransferase/peptidoglycan/xylan/chitin deacetylase (PgdA/CDA1 family)
MIFKLQKTMIFYDDKNNRKILSRIFLILSAALVVFVAYNVFTNISSARGNEVTINSDYYYNNSYGQKKVVLTFDDGPSDLYTKEILSILREYEVPAAFFVSGNNVIGNEDLIKEIYNDGHEIGGHSFTHSKNSHSSRSRLQWELNSTNKLIESVTGEPTIFYRPPFLLDIGTYPTYHPENSTPALSWIKEAGYITVGSDINTHDFEAKTSIDIVNSILEGAENGRHIILLHDGGGERTLTVDSLAYIIINLKSEGYEFVTVSNILGIDGGVDLKGHMEAGSTDADINTNGEVFMLQNFLRQEGFFEYKNINGVFGAGTRTALINWKLSVGLITEAEKTANTYSVGVVDQKTKDKILEVSGSFGGSSMTENIKHLENVGIFQKVFDSFFLFVVSATGSLISFIFLFVLFLGIIRVLIVLLLFSVSKLKKKKDLNWDKDVSVVIAAYNEEDNIEATIESVLNNTYRPNEVIVVDDGSNDATADVVRSMQSKYGNVIFLKSIDNGGKARAMNIGFAIATNEVIITIDGDTALHPDAISHLVKHFEDENIWAVAGKIETSRPWKILGVFQAIEYVTGQNIDKEAFNTINAIQVVPGAIGALRKNQVLKLGGHSTDTLVEDQDLTMSIIRNGGRVVYENRALAYTETPDTLKGFTKQRFRWVFGTIQNLWKHKGGFKDSKNKSFNFVILPNAIIFGFFLPLTYPLIDLFFVIELLSGNIKGPIIAYAVFTLFDLVYTMIAFSNEKGKRSLLFAVPLQRLFYRQLISIVVIFSIFKAIEGTKAFWNKVDRTGSTKRFYDQMVTEVYTNA